MQLRLTHAGGAFDDDLMVTDDDYFLYSDDDYDSHENSYENEASDVEGFAGRSSPTRAQGPAIVA